MQSIHISEQHTALMFTPREVYGLEVVIENEQEGEGSGYFQLKQKEDDVKCWCLQEEEMEQDKNAGETGASSFENQQKHEENET